MTNRPRTDFEEHGLSKGPHPVSARLLLLTVDVEAFKSEMMPLWLEAFHHWAACARRSRLRFCFFLSVEDAANLRGTDRDAYAGLLGAMRTLDDTGSLFYPHNHYVFDPMSGDRVGLAHEPQRLAGNYGKRQSFFWDAVYRHQLDLGSWLITVREAYERLLSEAGCNRPRFPVFRAGGWDYGDSYYDLQQYVAALLDAGFRGDSSACCGRFGTPTWRIGSFFGTNTFKLEDQLVEIAPVWSMDMSVPPSSLPYLRTLLSLWEHRHLFRGHPGAFVAVLHFDHLLRGRPKRSVQSSAMKDVEAIRKTIDHVFRLFALLRSILRLSCATFENFEAR